MHAGLTVTGTRGGCLEGFGGLTRSGLGGMLAFTILLGVVPATAVLISTAALIIL